MSIWWSTPSHMSHSCAIRRVGSITTPTSTAPISIRHKPSAALLLGPIVRRVPNIHSVVRWESRILHPLRGLSGGRRASIVVRRNTLSEAYHGVVTAGTRTGVCGNGAPLPLRYHCSPIMLVLMGVLCRDTAITQVRDVRVGEIGTHDVCPLHARHRHGDTH